MISELQYKDSNYKYESELLDEHFSRLAHDQAQGHFSLKAIDRMLGGIHPGRLTFISGEPATGKTTLLGQLADEATIAGYISVVNTLEVAIHQLLAKSLSRLSNGSLSVSQIFQHSDKKEVKQLLLEYREKIAPNMVFIDKATSPVELSAIIGRIQQEKDRPVILFQDYLQIMKSSIEQQIYDERLAVKESTIGLRGIANAHNIPVIAISSINRQSYGKSTPGLSALGASSSVEYAADTILHLGIEGADSEERFNNANLSVRPIRVSALKNRYGVLGSASLSFDAGHATFSEKSAD